MTYQINKISAATPPANALRVTGWRDLPKEKGVARFEIKKADGAARTIVVRKRNRRTLQALIKQPIFCASPVRISDVVHILGRDFGVNIDTTLYADPDDDDCLRFGVYTLLDSVRIIAGVTA